MPLTICNLPVITPAKAHELGYRSLTQPICPKTEADILANVASGRNPDRSAFIRFGEQYELAVNSADIKHVDPE